jgi:hypothetical protein
MTWEMNHANVDLKAQYNRMDAELKDAKQKVDAKTLQLEKEMNCNKQLEEEV